MYDFFTCMLLALKAQERAISASNDPGIGLSKPVRVRPASTNWCFDVECGINDEYSRKSVDIYHLCDAVRAVIVDSQRLDALLLDNEIDVQFHDTLASFKEVQP